MRNLISYILFALMSLTLVMPTYAAQLCKTDAGISVAFFNGVWNTPADAAEGVSRLMRVTGDSYDGQVISYQAMYNSTGVANGATKFEDIAEVFIQRGQEIGFNPEQNFHILMDALSGNSVGFLEKAANALGGLTIGLVSTLEDLRGYLVNQAAGLLAGMFSNPPTYNEYNKHRATINTLALQGEKMIMVAHSQGNLFMNAAFDYALTLRNITENNIAAIHVAPASTVTKGPHILADLDVIINGLRVFGVTAVPDITATLPFAHTKIDMSGHEFVKTYLRQGLEPVEQLKAHFERALLNLEAPVRIGSVGAFTGTLIWDKPGDIDLHITEPNGTHVYYGRKAGYVGFLDVDDRRGKGPEHYYASCEPEILQEGIYRFAINNYAGATGTKVTLQASTAYISELYTKQVVTGPARGAVGDNDLVAMFDVEVTKNEAGEFVIRALTGN